MEPPDLPAVYKQLKSPYSSHGSCWVLNKCKLPAVLSPHVIITWMDISRIYRLSTACNIGLTQHCEFLLERKFARITSLCNGRGGLPALSSCFTHDGNMSCPAVHYIVTYNKTWIRESFLVINFQLLLRAFFCAPPTPPPPQDSWIKADYCWWRAGLHLGLFARDKPSTDMKLVARRSYKSDCGVSGYWLRWKDLTHGSHHVCLMFISLTGECLIWRASVFNHVLIGISC